MNFEGLSLTKALSFRDIFSLFYEVYRLEKGTEMKGRIFAGLIAAALGVGGACYVLGKMNGYGKGYVDGAADTFKSVMNHAEAIIPGIKNEARSEAEEESYDETTKALLKHFFE